MAQASLTARPTSRAETKVEHSDPTIQYRMVEAQRIKVTPGIDPYGLLSRPDGNIRTCKRLITVKPA